ncbi:uncharacterized protein LOC143296560 [Babylonia areolata]|uniref:uncharacterized protein LOC143296560 n=1 Tax=Babylonia areolata TaxID=304850 RepID=UPI003FD40122
MAVLALTARLEVFFVLAIVAGLHRVTFHVIPYAAANDVLRTMDSGNERVGFVMALITIAIPAGDCFFFAWMGLLEHLTGVVSVPMWLGALYGCMSALVFSLVGKGERSVCCCC